MRLRLPTAPPQVKPSTQEQIDPLLRVRILVETAMEQAQSSDANAELTVRQLAGELCKQNAALSDVRVVVQELYQGDRAGAEAYLRYLAKHGFPKAADTVRQSGTTQQQVAPMRTMADQNQAIAQHQPEAYGQVDHATDAGEGAITFYSGNLIAELVANSAYSGAGVR